MAAKNRIERTKRELLASKQLPKDVQQSGFFVKSGAVATDPCQEIEYRKDDRWRRKMASKSVAKNKRFLSQHR